MKSLSAACYYAPDGTDDQGRARYVPTSRTTGPWSDQAQHGGPPAALLGRATELLLPPDRTVGRFSMDLLGPIGMGPVAVGVQVLRPGRTVSLLSAELYDEQAGRVAAVARSWAFPLREDGPGVDVPPARGPGDGESRPRPEGWGAGYLDSIDWRWLGGGLEEPGTGATWMRPTVPLVPDETMTGLQRVLTCVDSASGVSSALDIREWAFMNTELTVSVLRPAVGEWVLLDAETTLGPGAVGNAVSTVSDERGVVARSSQTLLVGGR